MEFVINVLDSDLITQDNKDQSSKMATDIWIKFDLNNNHTPSYYKDTVYFSNHKFWDPKNLRIIWDDRLWLGNSYLELYKRFPIQKYLDVSIKLYNLII